MSEFKFIPLKCPNCGGKLEISNDMERFSCGYCGTDLIAERKGGTIALKPLTDAISRVQIGTDKTAAELALRRLQDELAEVKRRREERNKKWMDHGDQLEEEWKIQQGRQINNGGLLIISVVVFIVATGLSASLGLAKILLIADVYVGLGVAVVSLFFMVVVRSRVQSNLDDALNRDTAVSQEELQRDLDTYDQQIKELNGMIEDKKRIANF